MRVFNRSGWHFKNLRDFVNGLLILALHIIRQVNEGETDQTRLSYSAILSVLR